MELFRGHIVPRSLVTRDLTSDLNVEIGDGQPWDEIGKEEYEPSVNVGQLLIWPIFNAILVDNERSFGGHDQIPGIGIEGRWPAVIWWDEQSVQGGVNRCLNCDWNDFGWIELNTANGKAANPDGKNEFWMMSWDPVRVEWATDEEISKRSKITVKLGVKVKFVP